MSLIERPGSDFTLPSLGKPYGDLIPGGVVSIKSMTTTEEKLFGGLSKLADFEKVIDTLITRCVKLPKEIKPDDLYTGDRVFLMMQIRNVSYGSLYDFTATCSNCRAKWDRQIHLEQDLTVQEVSDDWQDPFELELPISGDRIKLRLFRGRDERRVIEYVDRNTRKVNINQIGDPGYVYRMALHLVSVESDDDERSIPEADQSKILPDAIMYMENLAAGDSSAVRDELEARTPGMLLRVENECPKCGEVTDEPLPVSANFFRASTPRRTHTTARTVSRTVR